MKKVSTDIAQKATDYIISNGGYSRKFTAPSHEIVIIYSDGYEAGLSEQSNQKLKEDYDKLIEKEYPDQDKLWEEAIDFIEVFADGVSNINRDAIKAMKLHGYILIKKV